MESKQQGGPHEGQERDPLSGPNVQSEGHGDMLQEPFPLCTQWGSNRPLEPGLKRAILCPPKLGQHRTNYCVVASMQSWKL